MLDTLVLSRIQFAANISFHILFPTITIALCWFLLFFKIQYNRTGDDVWMRVYRFWVKVFALTFAIGVVSGLTMSFQFGTNWPGYMKTVGNIAGPLLGYEVLTAFFLEATFLGIMLFGINRVSNRIHTFATFLVAFGTTMSAFWIISLNSWMQTPQGFEMRNGVAHPVDWLAIIFNPSMPFRLAHMLTASGITAGFLIAGLSAYRILKGDHKPAPRRALKVAIYAISILIPLQIIIGDMHGLNTLHHQPAKIAAIEGLWKSDPTLSVPLVLFGLPDEANKETHWGIEVPHGASLILTHTYSGSFKGLDEFPEHPPVRPLFFGFRIMVGMGVLMLLVSWCGVWQQKRKQEMSPRMLKVFVAMTFSGWIATLAGWYITEIGRQPYLVTGVLKTADAVTTLPPANIGTSLAIYLTLYAVLLVAYIRTLFVMARRAILVDRPEEDPTLQEKINVVKESTTPSRRDALKGEQP